MSFSESIVPQHAVVLPKQPNDTSLMTYVKSVSSIIGSSNVLAVFDNGTNVKIYLKTEKHVSLLVNQGLVLHGLYSSIEYAVPRGDKVVLSNVDPIIPDDELVKLLSSYGTLESDLMYKKPFTDCEYAHIKSDVRYVYMNIFDKLNFPCKLDWMLNDMWYEIFVTVEEQNKASNSLINCSRVGDSQKALPRQNAFSSTPLDRTSKLQKKQLPPKPSIDSNVDDSANDVKPETIPIQASSHPAGPKFKPKKLAKVKPKTFRTQGPGSLKTKRVAFFSKNTGNPHPMTLKKVLRNTPPEVRSRYPMDLKQLLLFFKQTYRNHHKMDIVCSLLGSNDRDTLERFKCQLEDVSNNMKSVPLSLRVNRILADIDAYLATPRNDP